MNRRSPIQYIILFFTLMNTNRLAILKAKTKKAPMRRLVIVFVISTDVFISLAVFFTFLQILTHFLVLPLIIIDPSEFVVI